MVGYYDGILGLIPVALLGTAGLLSGLGFGLATSVPAGAAVAGLLVAHAMFVNAPVDRSTDPA